MMYFTEEEGRKKGLSCLGRLMQMEDPFILQLGP